VTTLSEKETTFVSELVGRLRLVQADTAKSSAQERRELLNEELTRSLKEFPPPNRKRYLEALLARLPSGGFVLEPSVRPAAPAEPVKAPETFDQLFERFVQAAGALPAEKRQDIARRLSDVGLSAAPRERPAAELSKELRDRLGLPPDQEPKMENVVRLCLELVSLFQKFDERALGTMGELSKKSPLLRRRQDFRVSAGQYVVSGNDALEAHVRAVSSLIGSFMAAVLGSGKEFARQYVERFSPDAIEDIVTSEGGSKIFGPSKGELCWQKYREIAERYVKYDVIERELKDCVVKFMEKTVSAER
jgi:hypothetical protein